MFIHAKKLSFIAVSALLGSILVASAALGVHVPPGGPHAPTPPPPLPPVNCSAGGFFTLSNGPNNQVIVDGNDGCTGTAIIPSYVSSIADNAFIGAEKLTSVEFQAVSRLTAIGATAFLGNKNLKSIQIPSSVTYIGGGAFARTGLTSVKFDGNAPAIGLANMEFAFELAGVDPVGNIGALATGFGCDPTWEGLRLVRATGALGPGCVAPTPTPTPTPAPAPAPVPYSGPLPTNYSDRTPAIGDEVTISGLRLDRVTSCTIDGIDVQISNQSADSFTIAVPAGLEPGLKDLEIYRTSGKLTAQGAFTVVAGPTESPVVAEKTNVGSFNGYVAVYAKGLKGKTLSWRIAGKWYKTTVTSDYQVFQRRTAAVGLDVDVHLYMDGEKQVTKTIATR